MAHSIAKVAVHIVFSTKNRTPWLQPTELRQALYKFMTTSLHEKVDSSACIINGVEDHIHALCALS